MLTASRGHEALHSSARLSPAAKVILYWIAALAGILAGIAMLPGCAPTPHVVMLPSTAKVRVPIVSARAHVACAVDLGKQEAALLGDAPKGLTAVQVQQVPTLVAADQQEKLGAQDQLTTALYEAGSLQKQLDERQARIDELAKHDAAQTGKSACFPVRCCTGASPCARCSGPTSFSAHRSSAGCIGWSASC